MVWWCGRNEILWRFVFSFLCLFFVFFLLLSGRWIILASHSHNLFFFHLIFFFVYFFVFCFVLFRKEICPDA